MYHQKYGTVRLGLPEPVIFYAFVWASHGLSFILVSYSGKMET